MESWTCVEQGTLRLNQRNLSRAFDRGYIQGAHSLFELQRDWRLLFPDAFFFEVASANASARWSCLSRLQEANRDGGVHLAPNVGELLRKEIHGFHPAVRPPPPGHLA